MLLVYKDFEWDLREAAACLTAHGVSFREASTVFADENVILLEDPASDQLRAVGRSSRGRVLAVVHKPGRRIRILGATLHTNDDAEVAAPEHAAASQAAPQTVAAAPAEPEMVAATPAEAKPVAARRAAPERRAAKPIDMEAGAEAHAPSSRPSRTAWTAKAQGTAEPSAPSTRVPTTGWTAETYGIYWDAYSAARQAARQEGKSLREAQRLGREAGERAMVGRVERSRKQSARAST